MKLIHWKTLIVLSIAATTLGAEEKSQVVGVDQSPATTIGKTKAQKPQDKTALDRKKFSLFTKNLALFKHPQATETTRTIAAFNTLRFFNQMGEYFRSIALMKLNNDGLTPFKLAEIAQSGRAYHRVNQFINRYKRFPERLENPRLNDSRLAREMMRIYENYLTPVQKKEISQTLRKHNLSLETVRNAAAHLKERPTRKID